MGIPFEKSFIEIAYAFNDFRITETLREQSSHLSFALCKREEHIL